MNSSSTKKLLPVSVSWMVVAMAMSWLALAANAQNIPPGCSPTSDGGYICPGPGQQNSDQQQNNNNDDQQQENANPSPDATEPGVGAPISQDSNDSGLNQGSGAIGGTSDQLGTNSKQEPLGGGSEVPGSAPDMLSRSATEMNLGRAGAVLGMTADQIMKLKSQLSSGSIGPDDLQQLCVRMASKHISPSDVDGIVSSLNLSLSADQIAQLKSCTQMARPAQMPAPGTTGTNRGGSRSAFPLASQTSSRMLSSIEKSFRSLDSNVPPQEPSSQTLTQYGYSVFSSKVSTFAPVSNVPVGGDYIVGPGDELKIMMWGRINRNFDLQVERDGTIAIPGIGPLQVAGLTFGQAKKLIEERAGQITGVQVDVTMGRLRTIQVFVIGEVNHPGPFTVSALSHVSNALVAGGGITKIGSLRKVELRRGNQLVRTVDLYDTLMHGSTANDEQLEPNDVIFVPVIGPVTAVAGDVKRPAIYELRSSPSDLGNVVKLAGGISAFGYSRRVQVERVQNHKRRVVLDIDLDQLHSQQFQVDDGDLIKVYPVLPQQNEIVTVKGNVNRPGKYEWHEGMKIADLVQQAEGLAPKTFMRYAVIRREQEPNKVVHLVPVDLAGALSDHLSGPANIALQSRDELRVFSLDQIRDLPTVQVFGEVRNPGFYMLSQGMRVSDLVYLAGGLKDDAYMAQAEVARTQVVNGTSTRHTYMDIDLRAALNGSEAHNTDLQPNDQLFVWRASGWHLPWVVQVGGEVLRPGPYTVHDGERLVSVLERAGGMLPDAYLSGTVFIRHSVKQLEQKSLDESRFRLRKQVAQLQLTPPELGQSESSHNVQNLAYLQQVLEQSEGQQASGRMVVHLRPLDELSRSSDNVLLEDQDQITIPKRPSAVSVLGQVYHPTAIVFAPALTTRDYLERAGGPSEGADTDHVFVFKADGSILTDEGIKNSGKSQIFPLLPVMSGNLMTAHLEPGDTVYVPAKLLYTSNLGFMRDVAQIIASTIETVSVLAIVATR